MLVELLYFPGTLRYRMKLLAAVAALLMVIPLSMIGTGRSLGQMIAAIDGLSKVQTNMGRLDYLYTEFRVIVTYLRLLIFPAGQNLDYDYPQYHSFFATPVLLSFLLLSSLLAGAVVLLRKSVQHSSSALWQRLIAFGIFWFFLALSVESSLMPIVDVIFEHRLYLPSIGAFIAAAAAIEWCRQSVPKLQPFLLTGMVMICMVLAVATVRRNEVWRNEVTLWEDVTTKAPKNSRAWNNLGYAYLKHNEPYKSLAPLLKSIELNPSRPDAWNNIGMALDKMGRYKWRFQRTSETFNNQKIVKSEATTEWFSKVYNNAGLAYEILQKYPQAAVFYQGAIGMNPGLAEAYYNLGIIYVGAGNWPMAEAQLQMLSFINPNLAEMLRQQILKSKG
jgi:tetratricopeptide (TPR) repeat protein